MLIDRYGMGTDALIAARSLGFPEEPESAHIGRLFPGTRPWRQFQR